MADKKIYPEFTESAYNGALWVPCVNNSNAPYRTLMSNLLESSGVIKNPYYAGWQLPGNFRILTAGYCYIGASYHLVKPYFQVADIISINPITYVDIRRQIQLNQEDLSHAAYGLYISGDVGFRQAIADTWAIHASFAADKQDLTPITNPTEKAKQIRGYEYTQNGESHVGFTVDDIESNYPKANLKNEKGEVVGYDIKALIALLFESNRRHEERIGELEAKVR